MTLSRPPSLYRRLLHERESPARGGEKPSSDLFETTVSSCVSIFRRNGVQNFDDDIDARRRAERSARIVALRRAALAEDRRNDADREG
jgi:hypothetical protein